MIEVSKDPVIKRTWVVKCEQRLFKVSHSSFGWHINERVGDQYNRHVFGLLFDSKQHCLDVIEDNVIGGKST